MRRVQEVGWFQGFLGEDSLPPFNNADTVLREDADWADAVQVYTQAKKNSYAADAELLRPRNADGCPGQPSARARGPELR